MSHATRGVHSPPGSGAISGYARSVTEFGQNIVFLGILTLAAGCTTGASNSTSSQAAEKQRDESSGPASRELGHETSRSSVTLTPGTVITSANTDSARTTKPPLNEYLLNIVLHNPTDAPRWLLLPQHFPRADEAFEIENQVVRVLRFFELSTDPRHVIVAVIGATQFWAIELPAGDVVDLQKLRIYGTHESPPETLLLDVLIATEIDVGDRPIEACFPGRLFQAGEGELFALGSTGDPRYLKSFSPPKWCLGSEVSVKVESRERVAVRLGEGVLTSTPKEE